MFPTFVTTEITRVKIQLKYHNTKRLNCFHSSPMTTEHTSSKILATLHQSYLLVQKPTLLILKGKLYTAY